MAKIGLVVEGGGMKCAYGAGVMDAFLQHGVTFDYVIGVSAGASNSASYLAAQTGRNLRFYTKHIKDPRYFGVRNFFKTGNLFNLHFIYEELSAPDGEDPLDFDAILQNPAQFEVVTTNALTGKPHYFSKADIAKKGYEIFCASSALPAVCKPQFIDDVPYYDGGVSDSIPVRRAFSQACDKVVCVLSKPRNYVKPVQAHRPAYKFLCRKYPKAVEVLDNRHKMYTQCQREMFKAEADGRAFLFTLETTEKISTYKMDPALSQRLYDLGQKDFNKLSCGLKKFMNVRVNFSGI